MNQLTFLEQPDTVPSPICFVDGQCPRHGRAVLGPIQQVSEYCTSRSITCLTCGATGVKSTNTEPREAA